LTAARYRWIRLGACHCPWLTCGAKKEPSLPKRQAVKLLVAAESIGGTLSQGSSPQAPRWACLTHLTTKTFISRVGLNTWRRATSCQRRQPMAPGAGQQAQDLGADVLYTFDYHGVALPQKPDALPCILCQGSVRLAGKPCWLRALPLQVPVSMQTSGCPSHTLQAVCSHLLTNSVLGSAAGRCRVYGEARGCCPADQARPRHNKTT
jgi:hypothetical protein